MEGVNNIDKWFDCRQKIYEDITLTVSDRHVGTYLLLCAIILQAEPGIFHDALQRALVLL